MWARFTKQTLCFGWIDSRHEYIFWISSVLNYNSIARDEPIESLFYSRSNQQLLLKIPMLVTRTYSLIKTTPKNKLLIIRIVKKSM